MIKLESIEQDYMRFFKSLILTSNTKSASLRTYILKVIEIAGRF